MNPVQLNLFPKRGFGILLAVGGLAHDTYAQQPAFFSTELEARRARKQGAKWIMACAEIVGLEVHEGDVPTYVVIPIKRARKTVSAMRQAS